MLLFVGVIIWNVEHILYYTLADYQSQAQCAAEILEESNYDPQLTPDPHLTPKWRGRLYTQRTVPTPLFRGVRQI